VQSRAIPSATGCWWQSGAAGRHKKGNEVAADSHLGQKSSGREVKEGDKKKGDGPGCFKHCHCIKSNGLKAIDNVTEKIEKEKVQRKLWP